MPADEEWLISVVCEAFHCVPSVARREIYEANPAGMVMRILERRAYAQAKSYIERTDADKLKMTPMVARVFEIEKHLLDQRNARQDQSETLGGAGDSLG